MVLCSKNITPCYLYCAIPGRNIVQSGRMLQISVILSNMLHQASECKTQTARDCRELETVLDVTQFCNPETLNTILHCCVGRQLNNSVCHDVHEAESMHCRLFECGKQYLAWKLNTIISSAQKILCLLKCNFQ